MDAGALSQTVYIEQPVEETIDGESVQRWIDYDGPGGPKRRASIAASGYVETVRRSQAGGGTTHTVRLRWFLGLTGIMRFRWRRDGVDRILYISGLMDTVDGTTRIWDCTCEEVARV